MILTVTLKNSHREPLEGDTTRICIFRQWDRKLVAETTLSRATPVEFKDLEEKVHIVRAFPMKHRPVSRFARPGASVTIHCPVKPENVLGLKLDYGWGGRWGEFEQLILNVCNVGDLHKEELAGALNIWSVMKATGLGNRPASDYIRRIIAIKRDRIYFTPAAGLLNIIETLHGPIFVAGSGKSHSMPNGAEAITIETFKTRDLYGALQLSFLKGGRHGELLVDADIDHAFGLDHLFEVIPNTLPYSTHPYDLHEILAYYQELETGYRLRI